MDRRAAKRVAIVGAGTSGLAACKHLLARGFRPVVFEAGATVGGLWTRTLASTRLQSSAAGYRFSDFPWPEGVGAFPRHDQVVENLDAYARRFSVHECVRFRSQVVAAEYVGEDAAAGVAAEQWAGNGEAFGGDGAGVWHLTVRHGDSDTTQVRYGRVEVGRVYKSFTDIFSDVYLARTTAKTRPWHAWHRRYIVLGI